MTLKQIAAYRTWLDAEIDKAKEEETRAAAIRDSISTLDDEWLNKFTAARADARACMARWVALMDARDALLKAACGPEGGAQDE